MGRAKAPLSELVSSLSDPEPDGEAVSVSVAVAIDVESEADELFEEDGLALLEMPEEEPPGAEVGVPVGITGWEPVEIGPLLEVMTVSVGVALVSTELSVAVVSYRRTLDGIPRSAFRKCRLTTALLDS